MQSKTDNSHKSLTRQNKRVLITGASSGLGREIAYLFAKDKRDLIIIARSEDILNEMAEDFTSKYGIKVEVIALDLSKVNAAQVLLDKCESLRLEIDILINNAGFAYWGEFYDQPNQELRDMLNLMVLNAALLTQAFGRKMRENSDGKIIQIASTASYQAGPFMANYFASKAYLLYLSEAIQIESKFPKIKVVCPGPFHSGFEKSSNMEKALFFKRPGVPDAKTMAGKVYKFIHSGGSVYIPGFLNKLIVFMLRFFPRKLVHNVIGVFLSKK